MSNRIQRELEMERQMEALVAEQPDYIKDFFFWMFGKKSTTREKYLKYVIRFIDYCANQLGVETLQADLLCRINEGMVNSYFRSMSLRYEDNKVIGRLSSNTINANICGISTFYEFLVERKLVQENLCDRISRPTIEEKEEVVYLTQEEILQMLNNIDHGVGTSQARAKQFRMRNRDKLLVSLPLVTGIRISALTDINIEDIDAAGVLRVVEKEGKHRVFKLPDMILKILEEWIKDRELLMQKMKQDHNALFITEKGNRLGSQGANLIIKKYSEGIDKHITAHKLRATFATTTYEQTRDIYLVAQALGHKSTETTKRYARVSQERITEASQNMCEYINK